MDTFYNNNPQGNSNGFYEQQRYFREMEKYNNRLLAKMQGLQRVPTVTYKMVEEAIAYNLSNLYNVPVTAWSFARVSEIPTGMLWRHACAPLGVVAWEAVDFQLYTTPVKLIYCVGCGKVIYYMEKQETGYY